MKVKLRKAIIGFVTIALSAAGLVSATPAAADYSRVSATPAAVTQPSRPDCLDWCQTRFEVPIGATPTPEGEPIASMTVEAGTNGNMGTEVMFCEAFFAPHPQHSASNNTIHYGIWVECNYAPSLSLKVQIWVKPSSFEPWEPADTPKVTNTVGFTGAAGGVTACFAGASGQWQARFWGTATPGTNFVPYPAHSQVRTYPCT